MKQSGNNEMDVLLRSLAKAEAARSISNRGDGKPEVHLDADEMNAFVEGSLPPATRARYTTHLVDCAPCRKIVSGLTASSGVSVAEARPEQQAKTSFWETLRGVLSPSVLRYAVPALAILAVFGVGIVMYRQQQRESFVAQNQTPATTTETGIKSDEPTVDSMRAGVSATPEMKAQQPNATPEVAKADKAEAKSADKAGEKAGIVTDGTTGDSVQGPAKDEARPAPKSEARPVFAPEPPPAPTAAAKAAETTSDVSRKNEEVAKKEKERPEVGAAARERDDRAGEDRVAMTQSRKAASAGRGGGSGGVRAQDSRRAENQPAQAQRADQDEVVRTVSGRRFRRQGNAWIDTAYDGASGTVVVRGSEQYRALAADEPGLRAIAEQLAGEVIVVWKGRAYRIR